jgi:hypothetical protein
MARALYLPGRFTETDGSSATFALPNQQQIAKCETYRAEVEAALAAQFHRPVPLRLVLDDGSGPTPDAADAPPVSHAAVPAEEDIDIAELVDAPPGGMPTGIDRLTEAFPGAQLIDEQ